MGTESFDGMSQERMARSKPGPLVVSDPALCPVDGSTLVSQVTDEPALFRHGGYGATRSTTRRYCVACGWSLLAETSETRP